MDEFARLNVMYEGRVDIFAQQGEKAKRRCFWRGISKDVIEMTCVEASNTEVEEQYRLHVMGVEGRAELRRGDRVVGRYERASQESGAK